MSTTSTNPLSSRLRFLIIALAVSTAAAGAQIPDTFTNLQLLDKDTDKAKLVTIMRDWAGNLGVRCTHCHVTPDNLVGGDFASDEKAAKRTARRMLELARQLNRELLQDLPVVTESGRSQHQVVSCYTCHRGLPTPPRNLRVQLGRSFMASGVDGAMAELKELRKEHYGAGRYDFTGRNLAAMGRQILEMNRAPEAVRWLEMALEIEPTSADLYATLGLARLQSGELDEAKQALEKALELDPENASAQFGLSQLQQRQ